MKQIMILALQDMKSYSDFSQCYLPPYPVQPHLIINHTIGSSVSETGLYSVESREGPCADYSRRPPNYFRKFL